MSPLTHFFLRLKHTQLLHINHGLQLTCHPNHFVKTFLKLQCPEWDTILQRRGGVWLNENKAVLLLSISIWYLLLHPRITFTYLAASSHCWLMFSLSATKIARSFSHVQLTRQIFPTLCIQMQSFLPSVLMQSFTLMLFQLNILQA